MTTATLPGTAARAQEPSAFAGVGTLLRAVLRRDRSRLLIWVLPLGLVTGYAVVGLDTIYRTQADRQARAAVMHTPAGIVFSGPGYGTEHYTLGAMVANELGFSLMMALAIMSVLLVVRHTRGDEESGWAELLLSGAASRGAPLTAALAVTGLANLGVAVLVTVALIAAGLPPADSVALAVGWAVTGCVFGAVAAVTAQVFVQARSASGAALAVLGVAAVVRGVGDVRREHGSALSWSSPIAWAQQTRAFVDLRWWPLLASVVLVAVLVAVAFRLSGRRDIGAGLLAAGAGRAGASAPLRGPARLFVRLQRGTVTGWAVGLVVLGATYGSLTTSVLDMVSGNQALASVFQRSGAAVADSFVAYTGQFLALFVAGFGASSVLRVRAEETAGRAEPLLATALGRRWLLGSGVAVSALASTLLLLLAGLGGGLAAAAADGNAGAIGRHVGATLVHLPAVLVVLGVAALLVGLAPRLSALAWLVVVWALLAGMFGGLLHVPRWALDLSPFTWDPAVPAQRFDPGPMVVLTLVATGLIAAGLTGFRHRDIPA